VLELASATARNGLFDRFETRTGETENVALLTRTGAGTLPGTSQVAGVIWDQRSGPADTRQIDARAGVFGVSTPVADVPRTGSASFGIIVNSLQISSFSPNSLQPNAILTREDRGSGLMTVNFANNSWSAAGTTGVSTLSRFSASGSIGGADQSISGTIRLGSMSSTDIPLAGSFFGPGAAEVGASFGLGSSDANGSNLLVGTLVGRRGTTAPVVDTLDRLLSPARFRLLSSAAGVSVDPITGERRAIFNGRFESNAEIDPVAQTVSFAGGPVLGPAERVAAESDARFTTYRSTGNAPIVTTRVLNTGPGNPDISTQYVGLAFRGRDAFHYGIISGFDFLPRTGRATYAGFLYGEAFSNDRADPYSLTGSASLIADFGALTLGGTLSVNATRGGNVTALAPLTLANGQIGSRFPGQTQLSRGNSLYAEFTGAAGATGSLTGNFYGPELEELGAVFQLIAAADGTVLLGNGAIIAKRGALSDSPSPPTPPTPAAPINTSLDPIAASETFAAVARRATAFFPGEGTSPIPARATDLTVRYDVDTQSYTVEEGGQSARFVPNDVVGGSRLVDLFRTTSAGGLDTLNLTRTGPNGFAQTRHVAGGIWLRDETTGGIRSFQARSFVFGVPTPAGDVPRTGTSRFGLVLNALVPMEQNRVGPAVTQYNGSTLLQVDWARPLVESTGIGYFREALPPGSTSAASIAPFSFSLSGTLNSDGVFSGSLSSRTQPSFGGEANGRLFGPGGGELGIALTTTSGTPIISGPGVLVGRLADEAPAFETMTSLLTDVRLSAFSAQTVYSTGASGAAVSDTLNIRESVEIGSKLDRFSNFGNQFGAGDLVAAESDARFATYRKQDASGTTTLRVYRSGSGNTELALSYASLMLSDFVTTGGNIRSTANAYGLPALGSALPRTGTGAYRGVAYGSGVVAGGDAYALRGTVNLTVDWAADRLDGGLALNATNNRTMTSEALGAVSISGAALDRNFASFQGNLGGTGITGGVQGALFGPLGQEIGGSFLLNAPVAAGTLRAQGAFVGTRN
jgi:hypothetical protein